MLSVFDFHADACLFVFQLVKALTWEMDSERSTLLFIYETITSVRLQLVVINKRMAGLWES